MISFSELLKQDVGDDLNEQALTDLGFIVDAASRMRQLIQDLLTLSRTGRSAIQTDEISLEECRQHATNALQLRLTETHAELTGSELPNVVGDRTMLTQLYQNLIGNALKFVTGRVPKITFTVEDGGDQWILGIQDNGIGIQPEYTERIFKPFQRLHRRDQYEGTGIGLSICRKAVERHGGRLWVESVPGEGSHFKFTLPKLPENRECKSVNETPDEALLSC